MLLNVLMLAPGRLRRCERPFPGKRFSGANVIRDTSGLAASAAASSAAMASAVVITPLVGAAASLTLVGAAASLTLVAVELSVGGALGATAWLEELSWPPAELDRARLTGSAARGSDALSSGGADGASPSGLRKTGVGSLLFSSTRKKLSLLPLNAMTLSIPLSDEFSRAEPQSRAFLRGVQHAIGPLIADELEGTALEKLQGPAISREILPQSRSWGA